MKFVDDLLAAGITPMVTLFHWDLPANLDKRYGGLLNKKEFVADYAHFSRVVFEAMGSRVKHWVTFNEPWCSSILGHSTGLFAPGRTSDRSKSAEGDSSREPWIVGQNLLIAHGSAVKIYREEFKQRDGGEIGITLNGTVKIILYYLSTASSPKLQATTYTRGTPMTQKTSRHASGNSSSPLPGSQTPSTKATTPNR